MIKQKLGVDIGGVIAERWQPGIDSDPLAVRSVEYAFSSLNLLKEYFEIFLISQVTRDGEAMTRNWLAHHQFFELTGIAEDHVDIFTGVHTVKAEKCLELGIEIFIDDHISVLQPMIGIIPELYFFQPTLEEQSRYVYLLNHVHQVWSWTEIRILLLNKLVPH